MTSKITSLLLAAAFIILISAGPAFAYIDPGSGSAVISIIIGAFVAAGLAIKSFWYKITGFFSGSKSSSQDIDSNN